MVGPVGVVIVPSYGGGYRIHADGCRDLKKERGSHPWHLEGVTSRRDVVLHIYPGTDPEYYEVYREDVDFLPCLRELPE